MFKVLGMHSFDSSSDFIQGIYFIWDQGVALAREKLAGSIDGVVNIFLIVVF